MSGNRRPLWKRLALFEVSQRIMAHVLDCSTKVVFVYMQPFIIKLMGLTFDVCNIRRTQNLSLQIKLEKTFDCSFIIEVSLNWWRLTTYLSTFALQFCQFGFYCFGHILSIAYFTLTFHMICLWQRVTSTKSKFKEAFPNTSGGGGIEKTHMRFNGIPAGRKLCGFFENFSRIL